jgi:hypothetical protein
MSAEEFYLRSYYQDAAADHCLKNHKVMHTHILINSMKKCNNTELNQYITIFNYMVNDIPFDESIFNNGGFNDLDFCIGILFIEVYMECKNKIINDSIGIQLNILSDNISKINDKRCVKYLLSLLDTSQFAGLYISLLKECDILFKPILIMNNYKKIKYNRRNKTNFMIENLNYATKKFVGEVIDDIFPSEICKLINMYISV